MSGDMVRSERRSMYDAEMPSDWHNWMIRLKRKLGEGAKWASETSLLLVLMRDNLDEPAFEHAVDKACEDYEVSPETLIKYERVIRASKVGCYYTASLSYSHHDAVYYVELTNAQRHDILQEAVEHSYTVSQTRKRALEVADKNRAFEVQSETEVKAGDLPISKKEAARRKFIKADELLLEGMRIVEALCLPDEEAAAWIDKVNVYRSL